MTRHRRRVIFSGIKPSGRLTLGNYPGALRHFVAVQHTGLCIFSVVDLHALTVEHDPARLRALTRQTALLEILGGCLGEGDLAGAGGTLLVLQRPQAGRHRRRDHPAGASAGPLCRTGRRPGGAGAVLRRGAERAAGLASSTLTAAKHAIGLAA